MVTNQSRLCPLAPHVIQESTVSQEQFDFSDSYSQVPRPSAPQSVLLAEGTAKTALGVQQTILDSIKQLQRQKMSSRKVLMDFGLTWLDFACFAFFWVVMAYFVLLWLPLSSSDMTTSPYHRDIIKNSSWYLRDIVMVFDIYDHIIMISTWYHYLLMRAPSWSRHDVIVKWSWRDHDMLMYMSLPSSSWPHHDDDHDLIMISSWHYHDLIMVSSWRLRDERGGDHHALPPHPFSPVLMHTSAHNKKWILFVELAAGLDGWKKPLEKLTKRATALGDAGCGGIVS